MQHKAVYLLSCKSTLYVSGVNYTHLQERWMLQFDCTATCHQHTHSTAPKPNYTKDTICCICKETVTSIAPEDGRISPKHVELKEHK